MNSRALQVLFLLCGFLLSGTSAEAGPLSAPICGPGLYGQGALSTFAGGGPIDARTTRKNFEDGVGTNAQFAKPYGIAVSNDNTYLIVAEKDGNRVRKIQINTRTVTTQAGPTCATDSCAGCLDHQCCQVGICSAARIGDVVKGSSDGDGTAATFYQPVALAIHPSKNYAIIVDQGNNRIRRVMLDTGVASCIAGCTAGGNLAGGMADGAGPDARFQEPAAVAIHPDGIRLYVADYGNKRIREIVCTTTDCDSATVTTIKTFTDSKPTGVAVCPDQLYLIVGVVHETSGAGVFKRLDLSSQPPPDETIAGSDFATRDGDGTCAAMKSLGQFAIEPSGRTAMFSEFGSHQIRQLQLASPYKVTTIAGSGQGGYGDGRQAGFERLMSIKFYHPSSIAIRSDPSNASLPGMVFVADSENHAIRRRSLQCANCEAGTYNPYMSVTSCIQCPDFSTSEPGSRSASQCLCMAGAITGSSGACELCAPGKYKAATGDGICEECPSGKYGLSRGGTSEQGACFTCRDTCPPNRFITRCSKVDQDSTCTECSECGKGFKIKGVCDLAQDTLCEECDDALNETKPDNAYYLVGGKCEWTCLDEYTLSDGECIVARAVSGMELIAIIIASVTLGLVVICMCVSYIYLRKKRVQSMEEAKEVISEKVGKIGRSLSRSVSMRKSPAEASTDALLMGQATAPDRRLQPQARTDVEASNVSKAKSFRSKFLSRTDSMSGDFDGDRLRTTVTADIVLPHTSASGQADEHHPGMHAAQAHRNPFIFGRAARPNDSTDPSDSLG